LLFFRETFSCHHQEKLSRGSHLANQSTSNLLQKLNNEPLDNCTSKLALETIYSYYKLVVL
jgi:hypothetical protein